MSLQNSGIQPHPHIGILLWYRGIEALLPNMCAVHVHGKNVPDYFSDEIDCLLEMLAIDMYVNDQNLYIVEADITRTMKFFFQETKQYIKAIAFIRSLPGEGFSNEDKLFFENTVSAFEVKIKRGSAEKDRLRLERTAMKEAKKRAKAQQAENLRRREVEEIEMFELVMVEKFAESVAKVSA
jgi:hypothetical protein